ncbi:hypothetical protein HPB48_022346 [Haemaphysalis longicornis]|uniref:Uncharacterized protein n=1 Tax=Haemaphysalis longicornis TaxID=44386 RepID=A0A9J6FZK6_HAELO|nr:hypothetical protein HPB48_022346 [Haemaphysalis longicornis]
MPPHLYVSKLLAHNVLTRLRTPLLPISDVERDSPPPDRHLVILWKHRDELEQTYIVGVRTHHDLLQGTVQAVMLRTGMDQEHFERESASIFFPQPVTLLLRICMLLASPSEPSHAFTGGAP